MKIRSKLLINTLFVLAIASTVAATSIVGMAKVRSTLRELTQKSTPFQIRTLELQRAAQGATADLVKSAPRKRNPNSRYSRPTRKNPSTPSKRLRKPWRE